MRYGHYEALKPVCPRCRATGLGDFPVRLDAVDEEDAAGVRFGALICANPACLLEFPIIDGAPILLADVRTWIAGNLHWLNARDDLPERAASQLGDCAGADSAHNAARQHQSTYAWDHWGEFDPKEPAPPADGRRGAPGGVVRLLRAGLDPAPPMVDGPALDVGTACGRAAFDLAERTGRLTLGIDLNWPLLSTARRALTRGEAVYPRRRVGAVYDLRRFAVPTPAAALVDFWVVDALAPPFADHAFAVASVLNVLDCVASPVGLLHALDRLIAPGGGGALATPFDWSPAATAMEGWIGGHSQRGPDQGGGVELLRRLLTPGAHPQSLTRLRAAGPFNEVEWTVRLHERSRMFYECVVATLTAS